MDEVKSARALLLWNAGGKTQLEIATELGYKGRDAITQLLIRARRAGLEVRMGHDAPPKRDVEKRLDRIIDLWNSREKTCQEIGQIVGLPRGSVARILSKARLQGHDVMSIGRGHEAGMRSHESFKRNASEADIKARNDRLPKPIVKPSSK